VSLTLAIALWGAALSTLLATRQVLSDRRRVRVVVTPMIDTTQPEGEEHVWSVRVVNVGHRPVEVLSLGVSTPNSARYHPRTAHRNPVVHMPVALSDGQSIEQIFRISDDFTRGQVTGGWASDTLGRQYRAAYPGRSPRAKLRAWRIEVEHRKMVRRLEREAKARGTE
jgi:hypothetical protein